MENLFRAWREFKRGKTKKTDVAQFDFNLEDNIFKLHDDLARGVYAPRAYESFFVKDPKLRHIHKAHIRDRVLHQALFRVLYPIFDKHFIFDSYSSRVEKGTHAGVNRLESFLRKETNNWTQQVWCLKCDVRKFFDSVDHKILFNLISQKITDERTLKLIEMIIKSFEKSPCKGLPLGNVTSQLFSNIYLNEFDQFAKHELKTKYYARYCDDFVIVNQNREMFESFIPKIRQFLSEKLSLELHPNKIVLRKARQGIDFLGYVVLPHRKVLRTKTKRRMFKRISKDTKPEIIASYLGMLSHGKNERLAKQINLLC